jgi:hypothetical protein
VEHRTARRQHVIGADRRPPGVGVVTDHGPMRLGRQGCRPRASASSRQAAGNARPPRTRPPKRTGRRQPGSGTPGPRPGGIGPRFSCLMCPHSVSIQAWSVGVAGRPKCWAIEHTARNRQVSRQRISVPLSDTASSSGTAGSSSSTPASSRSARRSASSSLSRPSASRACRNSTLTWVPVASAARMVAIHLRETMSTMA